jgi:SanA protein
MHTAADVPSGRVAIVFGAGLYRDGSPTPILRDRIETAVQLYEDDKVEMVLMSGDNRYVDYDEPTAMKTYAMQLGLPEEAITLDFAGRRTYDTCYRANEIFGLEEAILVTQKFHMPRALYLCNRLGVESEGAIAANRTYRRRWMAIWQARELGATMLSLLDVHVLKPTPVLGQPEPIFQEAQWSEEQP